MTIFLAAAIITWCYYTICKTVKASVQRMQGHAAKNNVRSNASTKTSEKNRDKSPQDLVCSRVCLHDVLDASFCHGFYRSVRWRESTRGPPICLLLRVLQQPHQSLHIRYHEPAVPTNLQKDASYTSQRCAICLQPCKRQRNEKQRVRWPAN